MEGEGGGRTKVAAHDADGDSKAPGAGPLHLPCKLEGERRADAASRGSDGAAAGLPSLVLHQHLAGERIRAFPAEANHDQSAFAHARRDKGKELLCVERGGGAGCSQEAGGWQGCGADATRRGRQVSDALEGVGGWRAEAMGSGRQDREADAQQGSGLGLGQMEGQTGREISSFLGDAADTDARSHGVPERLAQQRRVVEPGQDCAESGSCQASEATGGDSVWYLGGPNKGVFADTARGVATDVAIATQADKQRLRQVGCVNTGASCGHGDCAAGGEEDAQGERDDELVFMDKLDEAAA